MKIFTLDEANEMIPKMRTQLRLLQKLYSEVAAMSHSAKAAASSSEFGGGMEGGSDYVRTLYQVGRITTEINKAGVQLKDHGRGLIDFPSMRDDRIVLLCWQLDEGDEISWWHDVDAGFAGRQPL